MTGSGSESPTTLNFGAQSGLEVSPEQLASLLNSREQVAFQLVDCREQDEFEICRIEGAVLVPLSCFAETAPRLSRESPIIVYCHHGVRSMRALEFLRGRGWEKVFSLAGGIDAWSQNIDRTVPRY